MMKLKVVKRSLATLVREVVKRLRSDEVRDTENEVVVSLFDQVVTFEQRLEVAIDHEMQSQVLRTYTVSHSHQSKL